ncbi:hypothetical protein, partial [Microvirga rosea]|uniref:hypothetical protein n=1 Tax=Microvirga rosea TaxID=2715425 RepID=UPI001D0B2704
MRQSPFSEQELRNPIGQSRAIFFFKPHLTGATLLRTVLLSAVALPTSAWAQSIVTWYGGALGSYWQDPSNWDAPPSSTSLAIVNNGDTVNVDGSQGFASVGEIRIGSMFGAAGGTVSVVNGGLLQLRGVTSYIGYESGTVGNVVVDGLNSQWNQLGNLQVGYQGQGNVSVTNLGAMNVANLLIGDLSGKGTVTVSSGGMLTVPQSAYLGRGGGSMSEATLNVTSGSRAFLGSLSAGLVAPSTVNVTGLGSLLYVTSDVVVGEGPLGSTLNLSDGGLISVGAGTISIGGGGGTGTFNIGAPAGSPAAAPGTVQAASVNLSATSLLNFNHNASNYVFSPQITGSGAVRINGGTTRFEAANTYTGGTIVNGGSLVAAASGALGTGAVTVNGDTALLGYVGAGVTAAAAPITLNDSSRLTFGNGASAGSSTITIAADATPSLGAGLEFTQTSTAGDAHISNTLAPAYNGVTFRDSSSAGTATIQNSNGSVTSFQNGSTAASATITNLGNGATSFEGSSSAGSATITNQATGRTYFSFNATGG